MGRGGGNAGPARREGEAGRGVFFGGGGGSGVRGGRLLSNKSISFCSVCHASIVKQMKHSWDCGAHPGRMRWAEFQFFFVSSASLLLTAH